MAGSDRRIFGRQRLRAHLLVPWACTLWQDAFQRQCLCIVSFLKASVLENLFCSPGVAFGDGSSVVVGVSVSSLCRGLYFFIFVLDCVHL